MAFGTRSAVWTILGVSVDVKRHKHVEMLEVAGKDLLSRNWV